MRKNRKFNPVQFSKNIVALEVLEQKLLMTTTGLLPSANITPPSTNGWTIVTFDTQLNTSNISPNPGYNAIPSSFINGDNYTLRQIVGYYDNVYNSTQDWTVSLSANTTYTLSAYDSGSGASRGENNNSYGDLDVFAGAYSGMGHLILSAPAGSPATITCDPLNGSKLDRIFNIMSGGSLILKNVIITGGLAKDNGSYPNTDAFGGGILVESGGSLSLESSTITQNYAIGSNGPNVIGANSNTRQAAGYNAAGAGIYGSAGSTITIDSASVISYNNIRGGKGGNVSSANFNNGAGGSGGNAYGAGIAINAPASGPVQTTSTYPTDLYLDGGAVIANNQINNVTTQTNGTKIYGGTGGSCAGGKGGSGGNAYGAGLFMSSGALNMDGGSLKTAVNISNNSSNYGHGYTSNTTSSSNVGANGLANGAGSYLAPGLVTVANSPSSGGILQFSNNTAGGATSGLYIPTVYANVTDSPITANGLWNLRTAVAASTALSNTGMNIGLNLGSGNFTLNQGSGLSIQSVEGSNPITITGAGKSASRIIGGTSTNSIFNISNKNVVFSDLTLTGANVTGSNGGAIWATNAVVTLNSVSVTRNSVSYNSGNGGGIYQNGGSLTLNNSNISNNSVTNGTGGGIFSTSGDLESNNSSINHNQANVYGGGIYANSSNVSMTNTTLVYNNSTTNFGGAICQTAGTLTLQNSNISYNNATASGGGGIFVNEGCNLNVSGGSITNNNATGSGGGIQASSSGFVKIKGTKINHNSSGINGGGIANTNGLMSLTSASISNNSAVNGSGGGLIQSGGTLYVKNSSQINYNSASGGGGAYLTTATGHFNGGSVKGNMASVNGGGLMSWDNTLELTNVSVVSNKATSSSGSFGGGLYQNSGGSLILSGTTVKNNSAMYGGGVMCDVSSFSATKSKIVNNSATSVGAGFASFTNNKAMSFISASVSNNSLTNGFAGGGLYLGNGTLNTSGNFNLINNNITSTNNGTIQGAGIYATGTVINLNYNSFELSDSNNWSNANALGQPILSNGQLTLTDGAGSYSSYAWLKSKVPTSSFNIGFTYQASGDAAADGITLAFQNEGSNALGGDGGALGYVGITGATAAYQINLFNGHTLGSNFVTTNTSGNYLSTGSVSFNSGDIIEVNLVYNESDQTITETLSDAKTNATFSRVYYGINLSSILGNSAYLGFTGADGGATSIQTVSNFSYNSSSTSSITTISNNTLTSNGTATGAGLYLTNNAVLNQYSPLSIVNNRISSVNGNSAGNGVGAGVAFATGASFNIQNNNLEFSQNIASAGGNDIAFQVAYTTDNSTASPPGAAGINYFTKSESTGSLRSAITYAQNWMNGGSTSPTSMAIILPSTSNYILNSGAGQLVTSVPSGDSLTIIGTAGTATIQGWYTRTLYVGGSGTLVLQDIKITGGDMLNTGVGGGIYLDSGILTLNNTIVSGNYAGYTGTAAAGGNSAGTANNGHAANGGNGSNGASGYGGGIFMAGGTLNLLSNSSVTGNFVYGQNGGNGGNGQNGSCSGKQSACDAPYDTQRENGGNAGSGGSGGGAFGGGIYQQGGTLNSPTGFSNITGNSSSPGAGGSAGTYGSGASWNPPCGSYSNRNSNAGSTGSNGTNGSSNANYDHAGGQTVFSSNSTASAQSIGGLYQSAGTIKQAALPTATTPKALPGVTVELYSDDNKLIATATTDQNGRYRFNTDYSGIGYLHVKPLRTFEVSEKGSQFSGGVTSAFNPTSGKTDPVQLINGVVVNTNLNLVLSQIESGLIVKGNSIRLNRKGTHSALWQTQLMPKSYHGGFTLSTFDVNNDATPDYVLITKTGKPMAFIVDARTGQSTMLSGQVASNLRNGFVVQTANLQGDSTKELILAPSRERSGRISVIDLQAKKVLWNATDFVLGGMKINQIGADPSGNSEYSSFQLVSLRQKDTFKILDGATGKLLETVSDRTRRAEERQAMKAEKMQSASIASIPNATKATGLAKVSIPRRRLPVMN